MEAKDYESYWVYLQNCIAEKKFSLDESKIIIPEERGKEEGAVIMSDIRDANTSYFGTYQGGSYITIQSYALDLFLEDKYYGFEERQKLVDIIIGIKSVMGLSKRIY